MNMKWIVSFTVTISAFGIIFGLLLSGLNPWTSPAAANRMNVETAHQQATYELQERLAVAKTEAEIRDIQRAQALADAQYNHDIQALQQSLEHHNITFKTWMTVLTFIGGAISIAIILISLVWTISNIAFKANPKPIITESSTKPKIYMDEKSKKYWRERREWARDNEEWFRSVALMEARLKAATNSRSTDKDRRDNLPLAV